LGSQVAVWYFHIAMCSSLFPIRGCSPCAPAAVYKPSLGAGGRQFGRQIAPFRSLNLQKQPDEPSLAVRLMPQFLRA
jgi:hypothetical protein